jgi:hypothetical protein
MAYHDLPSARCQGRPGWAYRPWRYRRPMSSVAGAVTTRFLIHPTGQGSRNMNARTIGVVRESTRGEQRVALAPNAGLDCPDPLAAG